MLVIIVLLMCVSSMWVKIRKWCGCLVGYGLILVILYLNVIGVVGSCGIVI